MGKRNPELSPKEWQARHDAACAIVARKYCDMFEFWRTCRYHLQAPTVSPTILRTLPSRPEQVMIPA